MISFYLNMVVFLYGLVIGSFLNVCIYRIPKEESVIYPASHCMSCGHRLGVLDLIPFFSYAALGGKCRYCGTRISFRYPLVELLTGVVYIALYWRFGVSLEFLAALFLMTILIVVFFIDLDHQIIPHGLTLTGLAGAALLTMYTWLRPTDIFGNAVWWQHLLGLLPGSGVLFVIALIGILIYKGDEGMGMGDVYIFAPIGMFLGWKLCILTLLLAVFSAGFAGMGLLIVHRKKRKDPIPFGPFIVTATLVALLWGNGFLNWYVNTFIR